MNYYLAIDFGATSGRHIVAHKENGELVLDEVYRFKTGMHDSDDGLVWDVPTLVKDLKEGIKLAFAKYPTITSLGIDTWGVDYVLMNGDKEIPPYYSYRNKRLETAYLNFNNIVRFKELYDHTGIQICTFNTIFQLFDDAAKGRLTKATDYLQMPCYLAYKLTGIKSHEYTEESTGALLKASTGEFDTDIISKAGLPLRLFKDIKKPGYVLGELTPEVQKEVGGNCKVILVATHDTGSAFEAVNCPKDAVIISSGTWSLVGVKLDNALTNDKAYKANFTNEGGVGYIRFLKNIMGMWLVNEVCQQKNLDIVEICQKLDKVKYKQTFDVNDESLVAPSNMEQAIKDLLGRKAPKNDLELFASIFHSLALSYADAADELEYLTGQKYKFIYIVGGGAKNEYLNKLTEKYSGRKVIALPIEATALGNIKVQMKANNEE